MLSEEEKQAIDRLKYALIYDREGISSLMGFNDIKKVLQLVDKQQKEIKRLNSIIKTDNIINKERAELIEQQRKEIEELKKDKKALVDNYNKVLGSFISKDKIKKILGIEEDIEEEKILSLLQTIVDEFNRLEDIEDRKVQVEYQNVFNKGVKSVEDKIREKIIELEKYQEENRKELYNAINSVNFRKIEMISNRISKNIIERDTLNELLEE